jgi:hypothetical protein
LRGFYKILDLVADVKKKKTGVVGACNQKGSYNRGEYIF